MRTSVIYMYPFIKLSLIWDCVKAAALDVSKAGLVFRAGVTVTGSMSAALSKTVFTPILGSEKQMHLKCNLIKSNVKSFKICIQHVYVYMYNYLRFLIYFYNTVISLEFVNPKNEINA